MMFGQRAVSNRFSRRPRSATGRRQPHRQDHCYDRLHEATGLLAALAPNVHEAILAASAAGATHLNLDGTLVHTHRVAMKGPATQACGGAGRQAPRRQRPGPWEPAASRSRSPVVAQGANTTPPARGCTRVTRRPRRVRERVSDTDAHRPRLPQRVPGDPPPFKKPKGASLPRRRPLTTAHPRCAQRGSNAPARCSRRPPRPCSWSASARHASARSPRPHSSYSTPNTTPLPRGYAKLRLVTRKSSMNPRWKAGTAPRRHPSR